MSVNPCPTLIPAIEAGFVESIRGAPNFGSDSRGRRHGSSG